MRVLRAIQAAGDRVFNQSTPWNGVLDSSPLGASYHDDFGTPNYGDPTHGDNGNFPTLYCSPAIPP